jgi:hypothetical protein
MSGSMLFARLRVEVDSEITHIADCRWSGPSLLIGDHPEIVTITLPDRAADAARFLHRLADAAHRAAADITRPAPGER